MSRDSLNPTPPPTGSVYTLIKSYRPKPYTVYALDCRYTLNTTPYVAQTLPPMYPKSLLLGARGFLKPGIAGAARVPIGAEAVCYPKDAKTIGGFRFRVQG